MEILMEIHIKIILFLCSFPWILEILIENENFDTIKMFTLLNIIIKRKFSDFIKYDFMKKKIINREIEEWEEEQESCLGIL